MFLESNNIYSWKGECICLGSVQRQIFRQINIQIDRQIDKQKDRYIYIQIDRQVAGRASVFGRYRIFNKAQMDQRNFVKTFISNRTVDGLKGRLRYNQIQIYPPPSLLKGTVCGFLPQNQNSRLRRPGYYFRGNTISRYE